MDKESAREWATEHCLGPIQASLRQRTGPGPGGLSRFGGHLAYVTCNSEENFAGQDLGDWGGLNEEFIEALDVVLDDDALAAEVEKRAFGEVEAAEGELEERRKEVEKARKQLEKLVKKQTTAENKVKKATRGWEQAKKKRGGGSGLGEPAAKKGKTIDLT